MVSATKPLLFLLVQGLRRKHGNTDNKNTKSLYRSAIIIAMKNLSFDWMDGRANAGAAANVVAAGLALLAAAGAAAGAVVALAFAGLASAA